MFNRRYAADSNWSLEKKNSFRSDVQVSRETNSKKLKNLNIANAKKIQTIAAEKEQNPEELAYNPDRVKELVIWIIRNKELIALRDDLLTLSNEDIEEKYDEATVMHFIVSHLVLTAGGARTSAITWMRIDELRRPPQEMMEYMWR